MTNVEIDVERVRAVHAALSEVREYVWVLSWQNRHGEGIIIYATEELARNKLLQWLDEEWKEFKFTEEQYLEIRQEIVGEQCSSISDNGDRYYSFDGESVITK